MSEELLKEKENGLNEQLIGLNRSLKLEWHLRVRDVENGRDVSLFLFEFGPSCGVVKVKWT